MCGSRLVCVFVVGWVWECAWECVWKCCGSVWVWVSPDPPLCIHIRLHPFSTPISAPPPSMVHWDGQVVFDFGGVLVDSPLVQIAALERELGLPQHALNRMIAGAGEEGSFQVRRVCTRVASRCMVTTIGPLPPGRFLSRWMQRFTRPPTRTPSHRTYIIVHPSLSYAPSSALTALHCTALHCTALHCTALHAPNLSVTSFH